MPLLDVHGYQTKALPSSGSNPVLGQAHMLDQEGTAKSDTGGHDVVGGGAFNAHQNQVWLGLQDGLLGSTGQGDKPQTKREDGTNPEGFHWGPTGVEVGGFACRT